MAETKTIVTVGVIFGAAGLVGGFLVGRRRPALPAATSPQPDIPREKLFAFTDEQRGHFYVGRVGTPRNQRERKRMTSKEHVIEYVDAPLMLDLQARADGWGTIPNGHTLKFGHEEVRLLREPRLAMPGQLGALFRIEGNGAVRERVRTEASLLAGEGFAEVVSVNLAEA